METFEKEKTSSIRTFIPRWRDIKEYGVEMDGRIVDIYLGNFLLYCQAVAGIVIGYYSEPFRSWRNSETLVEVFPTHFMALPEEPNMITQGL